jgi:hypothetical protein
MAMVSNRDLESGSILPDSRVAQQRILRLHALRSLRSLVQNPLRGCLVLTTISGWMTRIPDLRHRHSHRCGHIEYTELKTGP